MSEWADNQIVGEVAPNNTQWADNPVVSGDNNVAKESPRGVDKAGIHANQVSLDRIKEHPYVNGLLGVPDAALALGAGALTSAWAGYKGLADVGKGLLSGKSFNDAMSHAGDVVTQTQEGAYQPKTDVGKGLVYIAGVPIQVMQPVLAEGGRAVGQALGGTTGANIGESIGESLPAGLAALYGGRSAIGSVANTPFKAPSAYNIPIAGKVLSGLRDVNRTRSPEGIQQLATEGLQRTVNYEEAQKVISALDRRSGEMVPGSPVTAADAIARANREQALKGNPDRFGSQLVSLQGDLSKLPETTSQLNTTKLMQEQARQKVLDEGSGTDFKYAAKEAILKANAEENYGKLKNTIMKGDDHLSTLLARPSMEAAVGLAEKIARERSDVFKLGKNVEATTEPTGVLDAAGNPLMRDVPASFAKYPAPSLQYVKMAMDKIIKDPKDFGLDGLKSKEMIQTRNELVNWMTSKSKDYERANAQYAIDKAPLNQMDLWRLLRGKLVTPTGKESPGTFLRTLQDEKKAVKDATGWSGASGIDSIFDVKNSALAARLAAEMEMEVVKKQMGGEVGTPGLNKGAASPGDAFPNVFWRPSTIAKFLVSHLAKGAEADVNVTAANILNNKPMLAGILKQIKPPERPAVIRSIKDMATDVAITGAGQQGSKPMEITITGGQKQ